MTLLNIAYKHIQRAHSDKDARVPITTHRLITLPSGAHLLTTTPDQPVPYSKPKSLETHFSSMLEVLFQVWRASPDRDLLLLKSSRRWVSAAARNERGGCQTLSVAPANKGIGAIRGMVKTLKYKK